MTSKQDPNRYTTSHLGHLIAPYTLLVEWCPRLAHCSEFCHNWQILEGIRSLFEATIWRVSWQVSNKGKHMSSENVESWKRALSRSACHRVCICMHVCIYVCMYLCVCVCMLEEMYRLVYTCMWVYTVTLLMHICMYVYVYVGIHSNVIKIVDGWKHVCVQMMCTCVNMHAHITACVCILLYSDHKKSQKIEFVSQLTYARGR